jgi:hypothetical protein
MPTPAIWLMRGCAARDLQEVIMDTDLDDDAGLSTDEAAEVLGLQPQTLVAWRHFGRGPEFYKVDRRVRYSKQALEEFRRALIIVGAPRHRDC